MVAMLSVPAETGRRERMNSSLVLRHHRELRRGYIASVQPAKRLMDKPGADDDVEDMRG
jgi:hypothetical protein